MRALAQRSSDAAKKIKSLISESSGQVERGVSLVGQAGEVLTKITSHINNISGLIGEIASGAQEQSTGLGEINIGVTQLDQVTQQNAAMVEQATASSHELNRNAGELSELITRFKLSDLATSQPAVSDNIATFVPQKVTAQEPQQAPRVAPPAARMAVGSNQRMPSQADDIWEDF